MNFTEVEELRDFFNMMEKHDIKVSEGEGPDGEVLIFTSSRYGEFILGAVGDCMGGAGFDRVRKKNLR